MSGPGGSAHPEHTRAEPRMSATAGTTGRGNLENYVPQGSVGGSRGHHLPEPPPGALKAKPFSWVHAPIF